MRRAGAEPVSDGDGITQMAERITATGGTIQIRLADAWRAYRGKPADLLELNRIVLDRLEGDPHRSVGSGNQIEGRVWIHESASVRNSVIVGPTVIGEDAHVSDAYIGPYTSIGAGARVEGAEIERSIIASGASVMHVGDRLVASVVGRNARVFRDFALPRALRLRVGEGTEVALC
jgi:glucose-1-phosphate thymidylyltransferase